MYFACFPIANGAFGGLTELIRARTSASLWAAPLPPLWVEDDEVVEVVEPWMAWLIQCSMLMLPWPVSPGCVTCYEAESMGDVDGGGEEKERVSSPAHGLQMPSTGWVPGAQHSPRTVHSMF